MCNERPSTSTWIYAAGAIVSVIITIFAVTFAIQEHNDRVLSEEITWTAMEDKGVFRGSSVPDSG